MENDAIEQQRKQDEAERMRYEYMKSLTNPPVFTTGAQGSILARSPAASWYRDHGLRSSSFQVDQAANGFIVRCGQDEGHVWKTMIATSIEEVRDIITAELVGKKLEG